MRTIKLIVAIILVLPVLTWAQEESVELFSIPLSNPGSTGKLIVEQLAGSIDVSAYEGSEVVVKATFDNKKEHYDENDENAEHEKEGLKRIRNSSLNIDIRAEEKDNTVKIINEQWNKTTNLEIKVPSNFSVKLGTVNKGNITVKGISGEMEISNVNGEITLDEVSGSASADTVNGDIKATFQSVTANANMAFSSLNGDLDITFPNALKANLKLKSDQGGVFTDFEMTFDAKKSVMTSDKSTSPYKVRIEQWMQGQINGGGPEMLFKTFNGDIMIRAR